MRRLAIPVLLLALLVATTAAFALTEALKLERTPIARPRFDRVFSPTCVCRKTTARLVLRLRTDETIDAWMVDAHGTPVRTLAAASRRAPGKLRFRWDGRDDDGTVVPDGTYRLRLYLARGRRTIVVPKGIQVDTEAPTAELVSIAPRRISPDGDGRADSAAVVFRSSEPARPRVLVDGSFAFAGDTSAAGTGTVIWGGTVDGRQLRAGLYLVAVEAQDVAGNISEPTEGIAVHIRYIELGVPIIRAPRGGFLHVRVLTDAQRFDWTFFRRGHANRPLALGTATPGAVVLRLPPRIRTGRYVLRVSANRHSDRAEVLVRPRR